VNDKPLPLESDEILTVKNLAEHLRVAPETIYRLAKLGQIPHFKVGGSIRFSMKVIQKWTARQVRD